MFQLLRIKQWTKNVFVLAALIFTRSLNNSDALLHTLLAVAAMCLASSATYIANDIFDIEKDRQHPKKKLRPIPSGKISVPLAWCISGLLLVSSLALGTISNPNVVICLGCYLLLQVAYNIKLRNVTIADVGCIAAGFVLRVIIGAVAIDVQVSGWILLCTATLALMLGFGKRRHEFHLQGEDRAMTRKSLAGYSATALDMLVLMSAACAVMTYSVYSIESITAKQYPSLILTTPFVMYGICRYIVLVFGNQTEDDTGEPESMVLRDPHLIATFVGFALSAVMALSKVQLPFLYK